MGAHGAHGAQKLGWLWIGDPFSEPGSGPMGPYGPGPIGAITPQCGVIGPWLPVHHPTLGPSMEDDDEDYDEMDDYDPEEEDEAGLLSRSFLFFCVISDPLPQTPVPGKSDILG